jgi:uroporphyrinogen-III synthase
VKNLVRALGPDVCRIQTIPAAVIGPVTAQAARQAGLPIVAEAEESTIPGLVAAVRQWKAQKEVEDGH